MLHSPLGCGAIGSVNYLLFLVVLVCMPAATDFIDSVLRTVCTVFAALRVYGAKLRT